MSRILDVDLLSFENGDTAAKQSVVNGTMRSLSDTGFVFMSTDFSQTLLDDVYGLLEDFFSQDRAAKLEARDAESFGSRGYTELLVETAAIAEQPDWKEMFNWSLSLPPGHPLGVTYPQWYRDSVFPAGGHLQEMQAALQHFHRELEDLQRRFLRIVALGVGAHESLFDKMTEYGPHLSRAIHYPPMEEAPTGGEYVWADAHADINLVTALPRATARGLQIKTKDGEWNDVVPPEDHVIVNTGIMLEHLTNGMIGAGWHRVIAEPGQQGGRISVVQFCHPRPSTVLMPLPSTVTADRPCRFEAVNASDKLAEVVWEINLMPASEGDD